MPLLFTGNLPQQPDDRLETQRTMRQTKCYAKKTPDLLIKSAAIVNVDLHCLPDQYKICNIRISTQKTTLIWE